jgi:cis-3-alkyl-4-acyloxetan-2-one decarboxylase
MSGRLPAPFLPDWLSAQLPFDRYQVQLSDGMQAHVMERGDGRPVVMFHGNPTWGYLYRLVAERLAGEPLRLIMPDLMGLGFSDRVPAGRFTLADHTGWMAEVVEGLEIDDAIVVVQDWGGAIGVGAVAAHPGMMTGLVVLNTAITAPRPGFKPTTFHRVFSNRVVRSFAAYTGLLEKNMGRAQGDRQSISGVVRDSYLYPLRQHGNDAVVDFVAMVPDSMEHPSVEGLTRVEEYVAAFDGPAHIVWGKQDPVLSKLLGRTSRLLPQAGVTATLAGHFLQEEVPDEIAFAIKTVAGL